MRASSIDRQDYRKINRRRNYQKGDDRVDEVTDLELTAVYLKGYRGKVRRANYERVLRAAGPRLRVIARECGCVLALEAGA